MRKELEKSLFDFGYIHSIPIKKGISTNNIGPLCHYFDILIDKQESNIVTPSKSFLNQFTTNNSHKSGVLDTTAIAERHLFVKNDDKKNYLIQEFIKTERNYLSSLESFIKYIVNPLRSKSKDRNQAILGIYECNQVFMNIEELYKVNAAFNENLRKINFTKIGLLFNKHLDHFKCYKKFLSGVVNARSFHTKEYKNNVSYQAFLNKLSEGTPTVYDYLLLPGQRLGHYKIFLKEIIKHTPSNDQDFKHLFEALTKIEEMASMSDDYHTKLIHIFQNMLQSIQNCPASLISQQRSLICHIDATEYELHTLKPINPVSIFLFTDKIMVVRRPSYDVDGLELCGLHQEKDDLGMMSLLIRKGGSNKRSDRKLKFRGWLGLADAEIYEGIPELMSSFILVSTTFNNNNNNNSSNSCSNNNNNYPQANNISNNSSSNGSGSSPTEVDQVLENYFQEERVHLFSLCPPSADNNLLSSPSSTLSASPSTYVLSHKKSVQSLNSTLTTSSINYLGKRDDFIKQFGNAKVKQKTRDLSTIHYQWNDHHFYGNVHDINYYHTAINKNESAVVFIGETSTDFNTIFGECYALPYTLFIVSPVIDSNYSVFIQGRIPIEYEESDENCIQELLVNENSVDEVTKQLLTNVIYCDQDLYSVRRMPSPSSPISSSQSSTKSVRDTIKQLNQRKSINTLNKLLSGSVQNNFTKPPSPPRIQQQRPKSTIFYQETSITSHSLSQDDNKSNMMHTITKSKSKNDLVTPSSSFLNYRAGAIKHQKTLSHSDLVSRKIPPLVQQDNSNNKNDVVTGSYRPSVHPSQTMSYEIKPQSRLNLNNNKSVDNCKADSIEEQVHLLCAALAQGVDVTTNNISSNNDNGSLNGRYEFQPKHQSLLSHHINSSSTAFLGNGSIIGSTSSPLFNLGNTRRNSIPLSQEPIIPPKTGESVKLSKIKNNYMVDKQQQQVIPSTTSSPISLLSLSNSSSPSSVSLESLVNEMEQMKADFDKRLSRVVEDYEKTSLIVQQLTSQLKLKEEELTNTKIKYEETVKENGQLYDAFKNELESIIFLVNQRDLETSNNNNETEAQISIQQTEKLSTISSNIQLRRKLELALKERNQWHQTACQLARELQDITISLNNEHIDNTVNEENATSTHISEENNYNNRYNNNDVDSNIFNKNKQHSQQNHSKDYHHQQQPLKVNHIVSSISTPMIFTSQRNKSNHQ